MPTLLNGRMQRKEGRKMPKFISKKHLEICNNLSYDLGFNQTIEPELFKYLPNTFFEIVVSQSRSVEALVILPSQIHI